MYTDCDPRPRSLLELTQRAHNWWTPYLFADDLYVWALVAHAAAVGHFKPDGVFCCLNNTELRQGWFPASTNTIIEGQTARTAKWRMDYYAIHLMTTGALSKQQSDFAVSRNASEAKVAADLVLPSIALINEWGKSWKGSPANERLAQCGCGAVVAPSIRQ